MEDKRRKTRIPIKKLPSPVEWILKNSTGQQLDYLNRMAKSDEFMIFVNLVRKFKDYNVYEVFMAEVTSNDELSLIRAAKRGEIAGLDALIMACQGAQDEIERRKRMKEVR